MPHRDRAHFAVDRGMLPSPLTAAAVLRIARVAIGTRSPGGQRARLSIFIYHRVTREPDPLFPEELDAKRFATQLEWIRELFNVVPLEEAVTRFVDGKLPPRAACITFDDGYADNAEVALPILRRHDLAATFFVATAFIDGGRMWNDTIIESIRSAQGDDFDLTSIGLSRYSLANHGERRAAIDAMIASTKYLSPAERDERVEAIRVIASLPRTSGLMLRSEQIRELHSAGMGIGAHTHTHPILANLSPEAARSEIEHGRDRLAGITRAPVELFAYPNGKPNVDYLPQHVALVKTLGFKGAVSTARGAARRGTDCFQLPRFTPWDRTAARFSLRLLRNFSLAKA